MTWSAPSLRGVKRLADLRTRLVASLPDLFRTCRYHERVATLPFGATVRPDGSLRRVQLIPVTEETDFAVANPTNPREGAEITLDFWNTSGGPMGAVTFGSEYRLDGAFEAPADQEHAILTFAWVPNL